MTPQQREQCARLYKDGYTTAFLADFYGRHMTVVQRLLKRMHALRKDMKANGQESFSDGRRCDSIIGAQAQDDAGQCTGKRPEDGSGEETS